MACRVFIGEGPEAVATFAARWIRAFIEETGEGRAFGTATGSTPIPTYRKLVEMHQDDGLDFSKVTAFGLDEYCALPPEDPHSFHSFMSEHLWSKVNIRPGSWHLPEPWGKDETGLERECVRYEREIRAAGGVGLWLLGLGPMCHIGFNMPFKTEYRTHVTELDEATRQANKVHFGNDASRVPGHAITVGLGLILEAFPLVVATGSSKAEWVKILLEREDATVEEFPGTVLRHRDFAVVVDEAAACQLKRTQLTPIKEGELSRLTA